MIPRTDPTQLKRALDRRGDYEKLWDSVPVGVQNAGRAGWIAACAGVAPRSAGTKLDHMWKNGYGALGLAFYYLHGEGTQRQWWRS